MKYEIHGSGELSQEELAYFERQMNGPQERCPNQACNHVLVIHHDDGQDGEICGIDGCDCQDGRTAAETEALLDRLRNEL